MNKIESEQLLSLFRHPGWVTFMQYKTSQLEKLHKDLEWEEVNVKKIQGQILEIRNDLTLQKKVTALIEKA